jgi:histidinol-phosphate aminotransferase
MQPKSTIIDLPVYQPGKPIEDVKRELGLNEVIKLASNENPYGCSELAKQAILEEMNQTQLYPDGASVQLVNALAEFHQVSPDQIIIGAGSDELIALITRAYLVPGDETVMATPSFPQYRHNALIEGATCVEVPLADGTHDLQAMAAAITDKTKIVWVCNPNNPSSTIVTKEELDAFIAKVPTRVMIVLDEAYCEYIDDPAYPDGLAYLDRYPNVIVLRTFSKAYGLAALRIGYGIGQPEVIRAINQVRGPFNTTRFSQAAACAALKDQAFIEECRRRNREGIRYLTEQFDRMGLSYYPAYGNFILVDCKRDAKGLFEQLMQRGVIVRGGHALGFPTSIRVTVGNEEQNAKFITALEEVLAGQ